MSWSRRKMWSKKSLESKYDVGPMIGEGSSAKVFIATRKNRGIEKKKVAIKKIPNITVEIDKLEREIILMRSLDHPNIVNLHEVFETPEHICMVMDYVSGGELFSRIVDGALDEAESSDIVFQIASALSYLHSKGITHRDLKPENLLCEEINLPYEETRLLIKVADFGFAKAMKTTPEIHTRCGSPEYCAPEIIETKKYDQSVDLWSLGVIIYVLLTGNLPFWQRNVANLLSAILHAEYDWEESGFVSHLGQDLVSKLLLVNPKNRLTAQEVLHHPWVKRSPVLPYRSPGFIQNNAHVPDELRCEFMTPSSQFFQNIL